MSVAWWQIVVIAACIVLSGTFSGLTLGLMSLDIIDLRVLTESGTEIEKKYANRILPVRKHGNFLLCTLLIGNTAVNSALSIVTSSIFGGLVGLFSSTLVILYIGEIIPQSICHRYGLVIGSHAIPMVKVLMALTAILSYPTSRVLDYFLGGEPATRYNKSQLRSLLSMHGSHAVPGPAGDVEGVSDRDDAEYDEIPATSEYVVHAQPDGLALANGGGTTPSSGAGHGKDLSGAAALNGTGMTVDKSANVLSANGTSLDEVVVVSSDSARNGNGVARSARRRKRLPVWARLSRRRVGGESGAAGVGVRNGGGLGDVGSQGSAVNVALTGGSTGARSTEGGDGDAMLDDDELGKNHSRGRTPRVHGKRGDKEKDRDRDRDRGDRKKDREDAPLTASEMTLLDGAFQFAQKTVVKVMTSVGDVFMLNADMLLNFDNLLLIFQSGHSRIPVYEGTPDCIFGVLFAKDLILLDPEDAVPIRYVLSFFNRTLLLVYDTTPLDEMLNIFKRGGGHLALVQCVTGKGTAEQKHETLGVCTLEDLIEELIGEDIVDETDVYTDNVTRKRVRRMRLVDPEILKMFDHKKSEERLSEKEGKVVAAYLAAHFDAFSQNLVASHVLLDLLFEATIVEYPELTEEHEKEFLGAHGVAIDDEKEEILKVEDEEPKVPAKSQLPELRAIVGTAGSAASSTNVQRHVESAMANGNMDVGEEKAPSSITIYKRGVATQDAYLVISGRVEITAGDDGFLSEAGPWTLLAMKALTDDLYAPDFTARISERPARILCIPRRLYRRMVRYSTHGGKPSQSMDGFSQPIIPAANSFARDSKNLPPAVVVGMRTKSRGRDLTWGELGMSQRTTGMLSGPAPTATAPAAATAAATAAISSSNLDVISEVDSSPKPS